MTEIDSITNIWGPVDTFTSYLGELRTSIKQVQREHFALAEKGEVSLIDPAQVMTEAEKKLREMLGTLSASKPANTVDAPSEMLVNDVLDRYWEDVAKRKACATTGFGKLDTVLSGGIEPGRLAILVGAPNTGKSTMVHQIARNIADSGRPVVFVTCEDSPSALVAKTLVALGDHPALDPMWARFSYNAVLKGWESERARINEVIARHRQRPSASRLLYLDTADQGSFGLVEEVAAAHFAKFPEGNGSGGGPGVIVVDYLQRFARTIANETAGGDYRMLISKVAEWLRGLSRRLSCGVLAIASQGRGGYTRSESGMGSLASAKESGDVEYACDVFLALMEDKERAAADEQKAIRLYIDKNRQGKKGGAVDFDFWEDRQTFTEV